MQLCKTKDFNGYRRGLRASYSPTPDRHGGKVEAQVRQLGVQLGDMRMHEDVPQIKLDSLFSFFLPCEANLGQSYGKKYIYY